MSNNQGPGFDLFAGSRSVFITVIAAGLLLSVPVVGGIVATLVRWRHSRIPVPPVKTEGDSPNTEDLAALCSPFQLERAAFNVFQFLCISCLFAI